MSIPFIDLSSQQSLIRDRIESAISLIFDHNDYVMGKSVFDLEDKLSLYSGSKHVITCSSGSIGLLLCLLSQGLKSGDAVFVPSFTFIATAEAVLLAGGIPVFVDVDESSFNISADDFSRAIFDAKRQGLTPKVVIPVDLFGLIADYASIEDIASSNGITVISDICQSFGSSRNGLKTGNFGLMSVTSFYPAKPLGCYGNGGAIFTNDDATFDLLKSLRSHGSGTDRLHNVRVGINGCLDTIQAAILLVKLSIFEEELKKRQVIASRYKEGLKNVIFQHVPTTDISVFSQYSFLVKNRDDLQSFLAESGIPTMVYYRTPVHRQQAYSSYCDYRKFPVSDMLSEHIISLPMHAYLSNDTQDFIIDKVNKFTK